jgi:hypothetical protein
LRLLIPWIKAIHLVRLEEDVIKHMRKLAALLALTTGLGAAGSVLLTSTTAHAVAGISLIKCVGGGGSAGGDGGGGGVCKGGAFDGYVLR